MLRLGSLAGKDIQERLERVFANDVKEHNITQLKCFVSALLMLLLEVGLIFLYISGRTAAGEVVMIGSVTAIFQYVALLMAAFGFYAGQYESVIHGRIDFAAIEPIMQEKPIMRLGEETPLCEWSTIDVGPMSFSYGEDQAGLQDISLRLSKGTRIAIVGESGAGKSTLLRILRGLTFLQDAFLSTDGGNMRPLSSLAASTTLIPQQPEIFENTIRYNITMGLSSGEDAIREAIWTAAFNDILDRLSAGLDSDVREKGVNLSGGEMQRLALARGIFAIRDSSIVLLDEPTGSVDPATEMLIIERLFKLLSGKCVVGVLHRLHLVRMFDYVYVMKAGRIVEEGVFDNLCYAQGEFARLWDKYQAEDDSQRLLGDVG